VDELINCSFLIEFPFYLSYPTDFTRYPYIVLNYPFVAPRVSVMLQMNQSIYFDLIVKKRQLGLQKIGVGQSAASEFESNCDRHLRTKSRIFITAYHSTISVHSSPLHPIPPLPSRSIPLNLPSQNAKRRLFFLPPTPRIHLSNPPNPLRRPPRPNNRHRTSPPPKHNVPLPHRPIHMETRSRRF